MTASANAFLPELTFTDDFGFDLLQGKDAQALLTSKEETDRQTEELVLHVLDTEQKKVGFGPVSNVLTMFLSIKNAAAPAA